MKHRGYWLAGIWCIAIMSLGTARGQTLPAEKPADAVEQGDEAQAMIDSLIEDLTGTDDAARLKAHKQLVGMGDAALPSLQKYQRGTHLPISIQRVKAVLDELETHYKFEP